MTDALLRQTADEPTLRSTAAPSAESPRAIPYTHLFRLLHWVLSASMVVSFLTGLSLHAIARPGWSLFSGVLPDWFWGGRVHVYHLLSAVVGSASVVAVLYLYGRRKVQRRATLVALLGAAAVLLVTGLFLLFPPQATWAYWIARALHAAAGLCVLPLAFAWHSVEGLTRFRRLLVPAFHPWASPRWRQLLFFAPLPALAACVIFGLVPKSLVGRELVAKRIPPAGGSLESLRWEEAAPLVIRLADGMGFDKGCTQVTLQALHDGKDLFVRAQWFDPTEDRRYQPWQKTADGWQQLVTAENDESYYYEDKFSLIFPTQRSWQFETFGCAACCHAGTEGHAYGSKGFDTILDVWHWKATRTDPLNQIDDKYWWKLEPGGEGGRHGDPDSEGGYKKNASKDGDCPKYLPATPWAVRQGGILLDQALACDSPQAAEVAKNMPPGTIVPGIVFSPFSGDRGDVFCRSKHADGRWEVLIRRTLDTGSAYDTPFVPGKPQPFGCAAFDHTSKRHAYGFPVYWLALEP